ncbi:MAG: FKBP-type peptidyl-prolyl cis-trans isomerase [Fimbriimonadaceae bacterium]
MPILSLLVPALLTFGGAKPKLVIHNIKVGKGAVARRGDTITVDYTGTLTNGHVFDSSKKPGRTPFEFILGAGQVIKGWDQGVAGMKVGGTRKLTIPYQLAYGVGGHPPVIPPKATLIFVIKLLQVAHPHK